MTPMTRAQLRREWARRSQEVADTFGFTLDQVDELLDILPYSQIPSWDDVEAVASWFACNPISRATQ